MSLSKILGTRAISVFAALVFCFGLDALVTGMLNEYVVRLVMLAGLYVTLAVSLNLINGVTGQFSIGHAAFYMVGAYSAGIVSNAIFKTQPLAAPAYLVISMLIGAAFAAIAGLVVGMPSLRLKGDYLAIVTLGFGEIIRIIVLNQEQWGGSYGYAIAPKFQAGWLIWLLAIICIATCRNLLKSAHGLAFLAVREDEVAAQAMGVNVTKTKVIAFIVGAGFAGAAGALFGHMESFINPDLFKMEVSFLILTMVVLGGSGSITGSVLAGATLFVLPELPRIVKFEMSLGLLGAVLVGLGVMVWMNRKFMEKFHEADKLKRTLIVAGANLGLFAVVIAVGLILEKTVPVFGKTTYDANKIRFMILAVVLLIVMLLKPTGLLGHHEFSWDWVKRVLNRNKTEEASA